MSPPTPPTTQPQAPVDDLGFELPRPARLSKALIVGALLLAGAAAFVFGYLPHRAASARLDEAAATGGGGGGNGGGGDTVRVEVVTPSVVDSGHALSLPATVTPLEQTTLYPRVSGYVSRWLVDIGDHVTADQVLAEIDTPETDAQLAQARAQLAQARAALAQANARVAYSKSNAARYEQLGAQNLVAKSAVEENQSQAGTDIANVTAAQASIAAAEANVRLLVDQKAFAKVTAPFAGVVTARTIERGTLVAAGTSTPLYTIAATDPVRVFVQVPQSLAPGIKADLPVSITAREYPGRTFTGKVTRTAGALDPDQRTMNTEVRVPNGDGALIPGMYVQAVLSLPVPHRALELPATALYQDAQGIRVATVDKGAVHFVPIAIERDTGATIQVATGLRGDEHVVKVAVPSLTEGQAVEVIATPAAAAKPPR